jgi:hypothetical protein
MKHAAVSRCASSHFGQSHSEGHRVPVSGLTPTSTSQGTIAEALRSSLKRRPLLRTRRRRRDQPLRLQGQLLTPQVSRLYRSLQQATACCLDVLAQCKALLSGVAASSEWVLAGCCESLRGRGRDPPSAFGRHNSNDYTSSGVVHTSFGLA